MHGWRLLLLPSPAGPRVVACFDVRETAGHFDTPNFILTSDFELAFTCLVCLRFGDILFAILPLQSTSNSSFPPLHSTYLCASDAWLDLLNSANRTTGPKIPQVLATS